MPTDSPHAPSVEALSRDVPCIHCGYNLRGLSEAGLCPECAHPIAEALRGDLLRFADPTDLKNIRLGITLKLWEVVLTIGLGFAVLFFLTSLPDPWFVYGFALIPGMAAGLGGAYLLSVSSHRVEPGAVSFGVRSCLIVSVLIMVTARASQMIFALLPGRIVHLLTAVNQVASPFHFGAVLLVLRSIVEHAPHRRLASSAYCLTCIGACVYTVQWGLVLAFGYPSSISGQSNTVLPWFARILLSALPFAGAVLLVWYVVVLWKCRRVLSEQVKLASNMSPLKQTSSSS